MNEATSSSFDCVQNMRQARERLNTEIEDTSYEEMVRRLRSHHYSDPFLRRLAERAAQQADAADDASRRR